MQSETVDRRVRRAIGMVLACCGAMLSGIGYATAPEAPPQAAIRFSDLNLNHPGDVAILYGRVRAAANSVCSAATPNSVLRVLVMSCVVDATERAISRINSPPLTSYYQARKDGFASQPAAPPTVRR